MSVMARRSARHCPTEACELSYGCAEPLAPPLPDGRSASSDMPRIDSFRLRNWALLMDVNTESCSESQSERSRCTRLGHCSATVSNMGKARQQIWVTASEAREMCLRAPQPGPPISTGPRLSSVSDRHLSVTLSRLLQPRRLRTFRRGSVSTTWVRRPQLSMVTSSRAVNASRTGMAVVELRLSQLERLRRLRAPKPRTPARDTAMQLERMRWERLWQVLAASRRVSSERGRLVERSR
mmetsp:Transcript_38492/g.108787  ORF Transcript_38492/g.108787 Transcript_38492/m.108787 type:complete len:238 (+) Transcript_38492:1709-2422(+)